MGYRYYEKLSLQPLFPFGHGLSYTTFRFSNLESSQTHFDAPASSCEAFVTVSFTLENTGDKAGAEVGQIYVQQIDPSISRPLKELKGFQKVFLQPGEAKQVEAQMERKYACSFWDEERDMWILEKGDYKVLVGSSSQAGFVEGQFSVGETGWWSGL